jgi:hypothetical protein
VTDAFFVRIVKKKLQKKIDSVLIIGNFAAADKGIA